MHSNRRDQTSDMTLCQTTVLSSSPLYTRKPSSSLTRALARRHLAQRYYHATISTSTTSLFRMHRRTLTNPMSAAFSRNAWRLMLSPYLRIRPAFFLVPVTMLRRGEGELVRCVVGIEVEEAGEVCEGLRKGMPMDMGMEEEE